MPTNILDHLETYDKEFCWQYKKRLDTKQEDLEMLALDNITDIESLKISDFTFKPLESKREQLIATKFIQRYEWLGTTAMYTTHWFGAFYKTYYAGVITMSVPNAFTTLMPEAKDTERLISRGACASWTPKGLASSFLMWCCNWMVKNTQFRLFTAYSDPMAKELGTIYQACNFYYLGNNFGGSFKYVSPYSGKLISDRSFRHYSYYRHYAEELGLVWNPQWSPEGHIDWTKIPEDIAKSLKDRSKWHQEHAKKIEIKSKHKYAFVLGRNKYETKRLRRVFLERNKTYPYPKVRGE